MRGTTGRNWLIASCLAAALAFLNLALLGSTGTDDPYITFSAARAFAETGLFTNINGDALEQSTSLLQVLVLTPFAAALPFQTLPTVAWLISIAGYTAALLLAYGFLRRSLGPWTSLMAMSTIGLVPYWAYWSYSGLETPLTVASALAYLALISTHARLRQPLLWGLVTGAVFFVLWMARQDVAIAMFAATGVYFALVWRRLSAVQRKGTAILLLSQVGFVVLLSSVRLATTGSPVPQSVSAKSGRTLSTALEGAISYLSLSWSAFWIPTAIVAAFMAVVISGRKNLTDDQLLLASAGSAALVMALATGGDWMPYGRFLALPLVLTVMLLFTFLPRITVSQQALLAGPAVLLLILSYGGVVANGLGSRTGDRWQIASSQSLRVWQPSDIRFNKWASIHLRDSLFLTQAVPVVDQLIRERGSITIGSGQGGMVLYYLKGLYGDKITFHDRFSLLTDSFDCENIPAGRAGRSVPWSTWLQTAGDCSPPLPDIMFNIGTYPPELDAEYQQVIDVQGSLERRSASLSINQWLAVRDDIEVRG